MSGRKPRGPGPTAPERRILRAIGEFQDENGYPASIRQIAARVGMNPSSTHYHVAILTRNGHLRRGAGRGRTLTLMEASIDDPRLDDVAELAKRLADGDTRDRAVAGLLVQIAKDWQRLTSDSRDAVLEAVDALDIEFDSRALAGAGEG